MITTMSQINIVSFFYFLNFDLLLSIKNYTFLNAHNINFLSLFHYFVLFVGQWIRPYALLFRFLYIRIEASSAMQ
jgi:hypothetical protein